MKTFYKGFYMLLVILLFSQHSLVAQNKEIPITTSSKEALKLFLDGREKSEAYERVAAAKLFDQALEKDSNFAMAYLYRATSSDGNVDFRKNLDKGVGLIDKVSKGEKMLILYNQASADGNGQKQKEYLDQMLKLYPSDKRVQLIAGRYFNSINDYSLALSYFTKSNEIDPDFAIAHMATGYCQSSLNNYLEAEKAFQKYINLIPDKGDGYDSYGDLLVKLGKFDESIAQYKKALEKNPESLYSDVGIGNNYIFKGEYDIARKYYQNYYDKAKITDSKLWALSMKSISYVHEGKIDSALKVYDEYRALAEKENLPNEVINSYSAQAEILFETENPKEGFKYYEKAVSLIKDSKLSDEDKENYNFYSSVWYFYLLTVNNEIKKAEDAFKICKQKLEVRKNPGEEMFLNMAAGFFEIKRGNYDKAIEFFSKSYKENPFCWYYTAVAYTKKDDKQNATKYFGKVANCNVNSLELAVFRKLAMDELKK